MGYSKDQLLARLQELQIEFSQYEHPVVMTVEAQAKYVGNTGAGLSKNLFLKDKKNRFYVVSALADAKVDLKVLSQRLGLGKGGLRMAPEEALGEILQVPLGCVTPFALVNDSAGHVSLLLDQGFKGQDRCLFHPLSNDMTISLNVSELDKFLRSIGRDSSYVDLEANPPVGKDNPPDLADLVPSDSIVLSDPPEKAASLQGPRNDHVISDNKSTEITAKANEPSRKVKNIKEKSVSIVQPSSSFKDVGQFVEEILDKTKALLLSETRVIQITGETIKQHGERLGAVVADGIRERLSSELKADTRLYLNTAYTEGFSVARTMFQNTGAHSQFRCL
ncbi:Prolyl-tRNA synthetase associated domain-containing protein 1 [Morella rubra]|uniref:Prolyl-tRNA synthetase associated domain-containing protein 1 n=1 Tax=Morella rubra TaxID=262757 RepID=A0A6A1UY76_9ROSI|nr:Prolyl-tRNA synthetase associated domain-containing protein 1 [Morella rubra]